MLQEILSADRIQNGVGPAIITQFPRDQLKGTYQLSILLQPTFVNANGGGAETVSAEQFLRNSVISIQLKSGIWLCQNLSLYFLDFADTLEEGTMMATAPNAAVDKSIAAGATEVESYYLRLSFKKRQAASPLDAIISLAEVAQVIIQLGATGNAQVTVSQFTWVLSHYYHLEREQQFGLLHRLQDYPISGTNRDQFCLNYERLVGLYFISLAQSSDPVSDNDNPRVLLDGNPVLDSSSYLTNANGETIIDTVGFVRARGELFYEGDTPVARLAYAPTRILPLIQMVDYKVLQLPIVNQVNIIWGTAGITNQANAIYLAHTIRPCDEDMRVRRVGGHPNLSPDQIRQIVNASPNLAKPAGVADTDLDWLPYKFAGTSLMQGPQSKCC